MNTPDSGRLVLRSSILVLVVLGGYLATNPIGRAADAAAVPAAPPARGGPPAAVGPVVAAVPAVPAPVPSILAIPRPTDAEVAQVNETVKKLLAQSDPATRALVAKFPDLVIVKGPRTNPAVVPSLAAGFRAKHAGNVEIAKKGDIDVLFMGDSITDFWRAAGKEGVVNPPTAGKAVFDKYYGAMKVANFGISGDTTQGVLYRLKDGEGQGFQPKVIMLMIGTNNGAGASTAEIAEGVGAIVMEMRKDFPAAKILLLGIFPRGDPGSVIRNTVLGVNPLIAKLHDGKNIFYLDIGDKFLDAAGMLTPDIMPDKLHPTEKGYQIWAEAVAAPLAELLK